MLIGLLLISHPAIGVPLFVKTINWTLKQSNKLQLLGSYTNPTLGTFNECSMGFDGIEWGGKGINSMQQGLKGMQGG